MITPVPPDAIALLKLKDYADNLLPCELHIVKDLVFKSNVFFFQAVAVTQSLTAFRTGRCQTSIRMTCWRGEHQSLSYGPPCRSTSTCPIRAIRADMCRWRSARRRTTKKQTEAEAGVLPPHLWGGVGLAGNCG